MTWLGRISFAVGVGAAVFAAFTWDHAPVAMLIMGFVYGAAFASMLIRWRDRKMIEEVAQQVAADAIKEIERQTTEFARRN